MSDFDTQGYLTREEAFGRLGISGNALWSRTRAGEFHPMRIGVRVYYPIEEIDEALSRQEEIRGRVFAAKLASPKGSSPKSLKKLDGEIKQALGPAVSSESSSSKGSSRPVSYSGEEASRAFGMFDAGKNRRQVLEDLKLRCDVVEHLYEKWQEFGDELHVPKKILGAMQDKLKWRESPPTAKGFWIAVIRYINSHIEKKQAYEPITEEERRLLSEEALQAPALQAAVSDSKEPSRVCPSGEKGPKGPSGSSASSRPSSEKEADDEALPFC